MESRARSPYIIAIALAILFSGGAFVYKFFLAVPDAPPRTAPTLGEVGSSHTHTSFLVMVGKQAVNFCDPKYMMKSRVVHFENDNCFVIHKHATGVTLPTFLNTLGVELSRACLVIPDDTKHCTDSANTLRVVLNGKEIPIEELSYYELQNNDHILINYGPEEGAALRLKYNQVPMIPLDVNEPPL